MVEEIFKEYHDKLLKELPLEMPEFYEKMKKKSGLIPDDVGTEINAKSGRAEKVRCFLQHVSENDIELLLNQMENSGLENVIKLADDIKAAIGKLWNCIYLFVI